MNLDLARRPTGAAVSAHVATARTARWRSNRLVRQRGALPAREAANLVLGVLQALSAAHEQGIVHRDLKPSNILVDASGRPRVMDFGIAARVSDKGDGSIVGSPGYISPEAPCWAW